VLEACLSVLARTVSLLQGFVDRVVGLPFREQDQRFAARDNDAALESGHQFK
jgi:hypothetical protein